MNQKTIKLLKNVTTGMVVLAVLLAFLISGIRIFGFQVYGVLTGSMEPTYPIGSLIYVKAVEPGELHVNDVITFSISPNVIATHRIVEVVPDENNPSVVRYRTKGDANNDVDASLVSAGNIIGKVRFAIPRMGHLASYIQQPPGLYVAILVCALMVAFVFYTDSLENKQGQNTAAQQKAKAAAKSLGPTERINQASMKLLGKTLIKPKHAAATDASPFRQGYVPQQPVQQPTQTTYQVQNQYAQQGYGQPVTYAQQPYYQQPAPQQYYNPYQQPMQPGMPQQPYPQQVYGQQQAYQPSYPQQMTYPAQPQQVYPYPQQGYQQPYPQTANQAGQNMQQEAGYTQGNHPPRSRQNRYNGQNQVPH